jgi:FtsH-binding integral membrane protein
MKDFLDKLQQAWQTQCNKPLDVNPDHLLKTARLERRVYFWVDVSVISILLCCGTGMFGWAFRDIQNQWPWLIYSACLAGVVGCILFNRWRRRRYAAHYDEPLLAHVEWSIKDIEHRMWLDQYSFWWYILPIALGCMIPPAISFAIEYSRNPGWAAGFAFLFVLLVSEGIFVAIFYFIHQVMKNARHRGLEGQRQKLQALRALRDTLLNAEDESHD